MYLQILYFQFYHDVESNPGSLQILFEDPENCVSLGHRIYPVMNQFMKLLKKKCKKKITKDKSGRVVKYQPATYWLMPDLVRSWLISIYDKAFPFFESEL